MREFRRLFGWSTSRWCLQILAAAFLVVGPGAAHADWDCSIWWSAYTSDRAMQGTHEECGPWCWWPHSCGHSWVDIVGGVSQVCNDHDRTFKGWTGDACKTGTGQCEWDMCNSWDYQQSQSLESVASVNQAWDRFPYLWGCSLPDTVWMNSPFFTVYDLDGCSNKQLLGSINFASFPLQVSLVQGDCSDPYSIVRYHLEGADQRRCCGGAPASQTEQESYYDWMCSPSSYACSRAGEDCYCTCSPGCSTCEPGQSCYCPVGCLCSCSEWSCNPWDTDEYGQGRCERWVTSTKFPSCQGGNTNNLLCSDLRVVGDYTCVWNWE